MKPTSVYFIISIFIHSITQFISVLNKSLQQRVVLVSKQKPRWALELPLHKNTAELRMEVNRKVCKKNAMKQ